MDYRYILTENRDRVGGADQRAEHQRPDKGDIELEQSQQQPHPRPDHEDRDQGAEDRHHANHQTPSLEGPEIGMQGTGKQQETQHAVHQGLIEIDLPEHARGPLAYLKGGLDQIKSDNRQRCAKRDREIQWPRVSGPTPYRE